MPSLYGEFAALLPWKKHRQECLRHINFGGT
jgi:hypothetical protein